jgi:hypothetical protein
MIGTLGGRMTLPTPSSPGEISLARRFGPRCADRLLVSDWLRRLRETGDGVC